MSHALPDLDTFADLVALHLDGRASAADHAVIDRAIATSAEHRVVYRDLATLDATLAWDHRWAAAPVVLTQPDSPKPRATAQGRPTVESEISNFKFSIFNLQFLSLAAALLIASGIGIYLYVASLPQSELPDPTSTAPLATLIESTPGSNLSTPGGFISEGRDYPRGEYALDKGTAEFMLTNSVNVKLRGETRMFMHNGMSVSLTRGSAEFVVPRDAKGFTVGLPGGGRVVDHGTRFSIDIGDGSAAPRVVVTEGRVAVAAPGLPAENLVAGQSAVLRHDEARAIVAIDVIDRDEAIQKLLDDPALIAWEDFEAVGDADGYRSDSRAAAFDGDSEGVPVTLGGPHETLTVAMWVNIDDLPRTRALLMSNGWAKDQGMHLQFQSERLSLAKHGDGGMRIGSSEPMIEQGRWTHIALIADGQAREYRLYIDGQRIENIHQSEWKDTTITPGDTQLGVWKPHADAVERNDYRFLVGRMDDAGFWSRSLTDAEIQTLARRPDEIDAPENPAAQPPNPTPNDTQR